MLLSTYRVAVACEEYTPKDSMVNAAGIRKEYLTLLTAFHANGSTNNSSRIILISVQLIIFRNVFSKDNHIAISGVFAVVPPKFASILVCVSGEVIHFSMLIASINTTNHVRLKAFLCYIKNAICMHNNKQKVDKLVA